MRRLIGLLVLAAMVTVGCEGKKHEVKIAGDDPRSRDIKKHIIDLRANDPQARVDSANALGDMRASNKGVVDALADALRDEYAPVRMAAANSLAEIDTYDSLKALRDASRDGYQEARKVYTEQVNELRQLAKQGNNKAFDTLERLGEKQVAME